MSQLLYHADAPWTDLTAQLLTKVHAGRPVLWIGFSSSVQIFALVDGLLTRTRQAPSGARHTGDGWPLPVALPLFATACGCGDAGGYRSTPPLLVAAVNRLDEVHEMAERARAVGRQLVEAGYDRDAVSAGHPPYPCGALYCTRITPSAITSG